MKNSFKAEDKTSNSAKGASSGQNNSFIVNSIIYLFGKL